jgi:hypothetical protein
MRRKAKAAIGDDPHPLTAAAISLITHEPLDLTLHHLRTLETEGQIRSITDEDGVQRWELVPAETGAAMELGAEVYFASQYRLTPEQVKRLGFDA